MQGASAPQSLMLAGLFLGLLAVSTVDAAIQPDEVLVVVNTPSPDATTILNAYLAAHPSIPSGSGENVLDLNDSSLVGVANISHADFVSKIRDPIRAYLDTPGGPSASSIIAIVLIRGIPHRIQDTDNPAIGDSPNAHLNEFLGGDATAACVDAELALLWQDLESGESGGTMDSTSDNFIVNPYFGETAEIDSYSRNRIQNTKSFVNVSNQFWEIGGFAGSRLGPGDLYLVCRIDGTTPADALASIDRAQGIVVNRKYARILLDEDSRPAGDKLIGDDYALTQSALAGDGWWVIYDETANFIEAEEQPRPMIAYAGYGANHGVGPGAQTNPPGERPPLEVFLEGFDFARGAVFNTAESFNGRAFNGLGTLFGQEQIADFITLGGTFGVGAVWEPFSFSLPNNEPLMVNFLVNRRTWAEAAWSSLPTLSWQSIVIGDPLATVVDVVDQPGDFDADIDVDADDVAYLRDCAAGAMVPVASLICQDGLLDADPDIDQTDFAIFQPCIVGADQSADPACMN